MPGYRVKTIVASNGERLPILLGGDGLPMFEPTIFSISEVRSRNRASNTIDSYLRSIMVLLMFLDLRDIDLQFRLKDGHLLSLNEVEELVRVCRLPVARIHSMLNEDVSEDRKTKSQVFSQEKTRMRATQLESERVDGSTAATRLRNIRDYLKWICFGRLSKHGIPAQLRLSLESSMQLVSQAIDARLPSGAYKNSRLDQREGLEPEVVKEILRITNPYSNENPWRDQHSQYRNALIIEWFLSLGVRRGELLNVRISDLDFRGESVVISRRADDVYDPRANQPKVKTRGRSIPLSTGLLDKTNAYIMNYRSQIRGARKHDFLFVASNDGSPLSIPAMNKVFVTLQKKLSDGQYRISPHTFRHTWNDRFSHEMDKNKIGEEQEKKIRSYLMGWSETSNTVATYTRRHVRKKAREASLQLQKNILVEE